MAEGILNVLKPPGMTSHDVISFLRRTLNTKKIGHAGTLDPDAAGVLPVFVGRATRLLEYVAEDTKCYRVELRFGQKTDTGDDSGSVISTSDIFRPTAEQLKAALSHFTATIEQIPPMYSAVRYEGKKLYELARAGIEVERKPRSITIYKLELIHQGNETIVLDVECSKGTYIRTLVEDIAEYLGMCGTVSFLLRTKAGRFTISMAKTLEEIAEAPIEYLMPSELAAEHFPELILTENQAVRISQGVLTSVAGVADDKYRLKTMDGQFIGIGTALNGKVKADKVINIFTPIL